MTAPNGHPYLSSCNENDGKLPLRVDGDIVDGFPQTPIVTVCAVATQVINLHPRAKAATRCGLPTAADGIRRIRQSDSVPTGSPFKVQVVARRIPAGAAGPPSPRSAAGGTAVVGQAV